MVGETLRYESSIYWIEMWWLRGHWSTVSALSCSRNQCEMSFDTASSQDATLWYSGRLRQLNHARWVLRGPKCANKIPPHHHTSSLNRWYKAGWIQAFMLTPHSERPSECSAGLRLIRPETFVQSSIVHCGELVQVPIDWKRPYVF